MFDDVIVIESETVLIIAAIVALVTLVSVLAQINRQKDEEQKSRNQFYQHLQQTSSVKPNTASFNEQTSKQEISESQSKKCLFCGEAMPESQLFCEVCGRRQD